ncbi:MAG: hypothetical protein PF638_11545 [Candidatus Delongbacteria bacterium]|jgi:hypothetical protein|nr:hypothetical protein [Candidatus Delongbacteria bacterium]
MSKILNLAIVILFSLTLILYAKGSGKVERLSFTQEDLPEITNPETFLPWMNLEKMIEVLKDVKHIKYKRGSLIEKKNSFKYSTILSKLEVKEEQHSVVFTNLMITENDTMQYSQNYKDKMSEAYNYFFPRKDMMFYRFVGVESIEVPAGKFECTVLEGFDDEKKVKYWMINDKPGIFAKIIEEGEGCFGELEYFVYELEEIK